MNKIKCAIIGSGNIGTDLMLKIVNTSESLILNGVIGIDPESCLLYTSDAADD